jgi:hypothetical protein
MTYGDNSGTRGFKILFFILTVTLILFYKRKTLKYIYHNVEMKSLQKVSGKGFEPLEHLNKIIQKHLKFCILIMF